MLIFFPEIYECDILRWKEDDEAYFETDNFPAMLQRVNNQPFVTFVGSPGSGKSVTVHHIALKLREEGYQILPITDIKKVEKYCDPKNPQLFVIDNIFGTIRFEENDFKKVIKYKERLIKPAMSKTKFLMTCRETVFKNENLLNTVFHTTKNVINMHSPKFTLTEKDKYGLLAKYNIDEHMLPPSNVSKTSKMFPLLCAQFFKKPTFCKCGPSFFTKPIVCILDLLDEMQTGNKIQYASLVLLMANQNNLSEDEIEPVNPDYKDFHEVKTKILNKCNVEKKTNYFEFVNALKAMDGTYTKSRNCQFSFLHDFMIDIVAFHFGRNYLDIILKCMSSDYIATYIKIDTSVLSEGKRERWSEDKKSSLGTQHDSTIYERDDVIDLNIQLQKTHYGLFAERLYSDIENGEFKNVFSNDALKHPDVAQAFIELFEEKSYTELYSVFLSDMIDLSKINTHKRSFCSAYFYSTLSEEERLEQTISYCKRVICLVIYFGHHLILQSIIDQIKKKSKNIHTIFQVSYNATPCSTINTKKRKSGNETEKSKTRKLGLTDDPDYIEVQERRRERFLVEQYRLLCIGCYSGDPNTVKILLKHIDIDALNIKENTYVHLFWKDKYLKSIPLVIASKHGFFEIVKELIKVGANVNDNDGSNTPLTAACKNGYLDIVKQLIIARADINLIFNEYTPLAAACEHGHIDIVIKLIKKNAGINKNAKNAPITLASKNGHSSIVQALLKHRANVNPADYYQTPLSAACRYGHLTIVQQLIKAGAHVNPKNKYQTPLTGACKLGNQDIIEALVESGAEVDLNDESNTPLTILCQGGFLGPVRVLIKAKADVNLRYGNKTPLTEACTWGHLSIVEELLKSEEVCVDLGDGTSTPLIAACKSGNLDIVKELIRVGADVNLLYGWKLPLTIACHHGYFDIVAYLIKSGTCINMSDGVDTPLIVACKQGHSKLVEELIKSGANVNVPNTKTTPLIASCNAGHLSIAKQLIQAGADVNLSSGNKTPLTAACDCEHLSLVEDLIRAGSNLNLCSGSKTPLSAACGGKNLTIVEHLIKHGADVNLSDEYSTPLITACKKDEPSFVKVLIEAGAEVNLSDKQKDTPLQVACVHNCWSVVDELIKEGAKISFNDEKGNLLINACGNGCLKFAKLLIKAGADVNQCSQNKKTKVNANLNDETTIVTPLNLAIQCQSLDIVKMLIKAGADVNLKDSEKTPMAAACEQGNINIVRELIKSGAVFKIGDKKKSPLAMLCLEAVNPSSRIGYKILSNIENLIKDRAADFKEVKGKIHLLTHACFKGCLESVQGIINAGVDVNKSDGFKTPLTAACFRGHMDIVEVLIEAGADVNLKDRESTPLTTACTSRHFKIVERLLKAGADVNAEEDKNVLFMYACYWGSLNLVKELIKAGANINKSDINHTPLTAACVFGHLDVVKELINNGADVNLSKEFGDTPLTIALDNGHFELVNVLLNAEDDIDLSDKILTLLTQLYAKRKSKNNYEDMYSEAPY